MPMDRVLLCRSGLRLRKITALNIKLVSKFLFTYRKRVAFGVLMCAFCNACWGVMNALDT